MKRAELGLLEVLGLLVRMPEEGDVTALSCFSGWLGILLSSLFGAKNPLDFALSCERTLRLCFSQIDVTLFLAGGHNALSRAEIDALSRGQTFRLCFSQAVVKICLSLGQLLRLCFSWAVVKVCQAVKVWPLHGLNPPKFHL